MANDANHNTDASAALARWNAMETDTAARAILSCCGSRAWADAMAARRPFANAAALFDASGAVWAALSEDDRREAYDSHPRIGQQNADSATAESLAWSREEQRTAMSSASVSEPSTQLVLAERNRQYEERFGRIFLVCADGKSAAEILAILDRRMKNTDAAELLESAEQQRQITQLRLRRWLGVN
jgi:2-oxo-4-hydroxy-4-carboxy-5-ureidoimidazoline decarboxylase